MSHHDRFKDAQSVILEITEARTRELYVEVRVPGDGGPCFGFYVEKAPGEMYAKLRALFDSVLRERRDLAIKEARNLIEDEG